MYANLIRFDKKYCVVILRILCVIKLYLLKLESFNQSQHYKIYDVDFLLLKRVYICEKYVKVTFLCDVLQIIKS